MAAVTPDVATGITVAFQTSASIFANLVNLSWTGFSRESIDTTHQGTATARTFEASDLYDPGELSCELQFDTDRSVMVPAAATVETVTITWPDSETTVFTGGFVTGYEVTANLEELMMATLTVKLSGVVTI